jgi:tRNA threonylcarbamoyladenosine biosynthesis protein TsaB
MLLLCSDTSGKHGSIALARGEFDGNCQVFDVVPLAGGTFSAQLVPQIAALLAKHGFTKADIDGFIVVSGPGSFTGLRVGLAAIKALAEILKKPIAAVSLLEVLAVNSGLQGSVLTALDAGRGEVYVGEYEISENSARLVRQRLVKREEVLAEAQNLKLITSHDGLAESARAAGLQALLVEPLDAGAIARLGWKKIQGGETVSPEQLEANYIRRSDAEIFAKLGS